MTFYVTVLDCKWEVTRCAFCALLRGASSNEKVAPSQLPTATVNMTTNPISCLGLVPGISYLCDDQRTWSHRESQVKTWRWHPIQVRAGLTLGSPSFSSHQQVNARRLAHGTKAGASLPISADSTAAWQGLISSPAVARAAPASQQAAPVLERPLNPAARGLAFNERAPLSTTRSWRGWGEVSEFQESRNMLDSLLSLGRHVAQVGLNTEPRVSPRFLILLASTPGQGGSGDLTTKPHLSLRFLSDILIYKHLL